MSYQVCVCVCVCVCVFWTVDCIIYFEQWIVSFILNSGLYRLFWTVDCIIYIEQWIVSFILNSGLYHLYWTVDFIIYFEQWIVSFILNSGLYHLFCTVDCIIYSSIMKVYQLSYMLPASWQTVQTQIKYCRFWHMFRVYSFYTGLYIKIFKKKKMHKWHPLNENGLAQIERIVESTKHKRVNIWTAACQNQQNDVCPAKTQISLGIRPVWSESSLCAWRKLRVLSYPSSAQRTDQTEQMPRLIWVFAWRTVILLVLSWGGLF